MDEEHGFVRASCEAAFHDAPGAVGAIELPDPSHPEWNAEPGETDV